MRAQRGRSDRKRAAWHAGAAASLLSLAGCHIVSDRADAAAMARDQPGFDAKAYVSSRWNGEVLPSYRHREAPADALVALLRSAPSQATARFGWRNGEDAPWAFVIGGEGLVRSIDRRSRAGSLTIALEDGGTFSAQTGPVVSGTALRDALPFIRFDDFPDQIAFAEVNSALNARSLAGIVAGAACLHPGDRVRFEGAFLWRAGDAGIAITPFVLHKAGGGA